MEQTRQLLLQHYKTYPALQIRDIFKFLHQSAFGCEHFVASLEMATERIASEYAGGVEQAQIEPMDGEYCRVPLCVLDQGLQAKTLGKLFVASAKREENGLSALLEKLEIAGNLVREGLLPFAEKEWDAALAQWASNGYPAVRHSDIFREYYHPAYRVMAKEFVPFLPLFAALDKLLQDKRAIVAIDGGSASGKTTLSKTIEKLYPCTVFHMDDFFLRPEQRTAQRYAEVGGNIDRERFLAEVLQPLSREEAVLYRSFDCHTMTLGEAARICPENLVVVEGAYSMHPEFEKFYDLSVFLEISAQLQQARILRRNGPELAQRFFGERIPQENTYFDKTGIRQRCSMTIRI